MRKVYGYDILSGENGSGGVGGGGGSSSKASNNFALVVFLCFSNHSQFCVLRPMRNDGQWQLDHLATIFTPDFDLIDFCVTPAGHLMALWTNPDGFPVLRYARFGAGSTSTAAGEGSFIKLTLKPHFFNLTFRKSSTQLPFLQRTMQTLRKFVKVKGKFKVNLIKETECQL